MSNWGFLQGIGSGLQQVGGQMMNHGLDQMQQKADDKRMALAQKALDERKVADAMRAEELAKTTQTSRRVFMSDPSEGPTTIRAERLNKFGDVIGMDSATPGEQAEHRKGFLSDELKKKSDADKIAREESRFKATEAGRDRRAAMSANRPRGETQGPAPQLFQTKEGEQVWVRPGDPVPNGARRINPYTPTREDSQPTDPNDWLSQF